MIGIIYKSRHGSTKMIAEKINNHLKNEATLIDFKDLTHDKLKEYDTLVVGIPVYYSKLDEEMVQFVNYHHELLAQKHFSIYVMALFYSEFMSYLTDAFSYEVLKDAAALAGLGGAIDLNELSISEKMVLTIMKKRRPFNIDEKNGVYANFDENEIKIFAKKIEHIDEKYA